MPVHHAPVRIIKSKNHLLSFHADIQSIFKMRDNYRFIFQQITFVGMIVIQGHRTPCFNLSFLFMLIFNMHLMRYHVIHVLAKVPNTLVNGENLSQF